MKKKIIKFSFLFVASMFIAVPVFAQTSSLVVQFEDTPLFGEANFLPGDGITKWTKVYNNTEDEKNIIVEAINVTNSDGFGDVLNISIKEDGTELYGGTLSGFFDEGEITLSVLGAGGNTQYDFTVSFQSGAENEYQEKSLGFDLLIGFEGDSGSSGEGDFETNGDGGGSTSGGGGGIGNGMFEGLTIRGDSVVVSNVQEVSVVINWYTTYSATSRVIYDTIPGQFDFYSEPNYGYTYSTVESDTPANPSGVNQHTVTVGGLAPGTTYYFRVVSHASPPSVSLEHSFDTSFKQEEKGDKTVAFNFNDTSVGNTSAGAGSGSGFGMVGDSEGENKEESLSDEKNDILLGEPSGEDNVIETNPNTQTAGLIFGFISLPYLIILILILIFVGSYILWIISRKKKTGV